MIDIRKLKELVRLMVENDLAELDLRDQEEKVTIKRGVATVVGPDHTTIARLPVHEAAALDAAANNGDPHPESPPRPGDAASSTDDETDQGLVPIESPMVGTFYSAPTPDADPFVTQGADVSQGAVVCLVEAMKVFNEIKAEIDGVVERVLVKNGDAVEFGQRLFLVRPA